MQKICMCTVTLSTYFTNLLQTEKHFTTNAKSMPIFNLFCLVFIILYFCVCTVWTELMSGLGSCHLYILNNMLLDYIIINGLLFIFIYDVFFCFSFSSVNVNFILL